MSNNKTRQIAYMAMYLALAVGLDYIKELIPFLNMPSGGSVNIALIPIVLASFHLGVKKGVLLGLLWWFISFIMGLNSDFINIYQYLFDYILSSAVIGAGSFLYKKKSTSEVIIGILICMLLRTVFICISGAYFWVGDLAAGSKEAWIASLAYNGPYCLATAVMLIVLMPILLKSLKNILL